MIKIKSFDDLQQLHKKTKVNLGKQEAKVQVKVHLGSCGIASGANSIFDAFSREVSKKKLPGIVVQKAACIGLCDIEPVVTVLVPGKEKVIYYNITEDKVKSIIEDHLVQGKPVRDWALDLNSPRIKLQEIRVLHNQDLDPMNIEQYIARGGYLALAKVLTQMRPEEVIGEVSRSGLRGRGGAGFPTAIKWSFVRSPVCSEKYVVCNGDEGDPGAYMNRAVLEGNPHSIIEGMAIGAYAIGNVSQGYAYVRAEYPLAIETLDHAIAKANEYGLLGKNILGTGFEFNLEIFPGAGAFVCGEETALLASIEGKRGNPRQRPPFPANIGGGLFGKPTTINNIETWSDVPQIILNGSAWFAGVGNDKCKGTKTLCLVGKVNNPGLVEVPLGISLGTLISDIGGGIPNGRKFKAVQLGGPSGGVIPVEHLNTPIDYESVGALGAIMGSGGVVVMDDSSCMVDVAKFFLQFTKDESCGKCTTCRIGIPHMLLILDKISKGEAVLADLDILSELSETITQASLCGLGQTAANPVLTTLRYFREEYEAHIIDKKCLASVCRGLFKSPCQHTCPVEINIPGYVSLIKEGKFAEAYCMIKQRNPLPSVCGMVCNHPCEAKCNRAQIEESIAIRDLKRFASDWALRNGIKYSPKLKAKKPEKVAIIGSGPAGLSAAWDLAIEGYKVTIFEALPVAGGMLAVAIPEYRLPKKVLRKEIQEIQDLGVEIKLNSPVTDAADLLNQGYKAVFIASGAHAEVKLGVPGEDLNGVFDAIKFLREVHLDKPIKVGKKVAVIGGGNSAIDSARVALRKGAKEVHIFYRREKADIPADKEEIIAAEEEGIQFHYLTAPVKVLGNGKVDGLELTKMALGEFDLTGRKIASAIPGSEYEVAVDTIISAIGQRPTPSFVKEGTIKIARNKTIVADKRTLATGMKGVFAGGDAVTGPWTVINAIAAGQRAASSIRRYLEGSELSARLESSGFEPISISQTPTSEEELKEKARAVNQEIGLKDRKTSFREVIIPFSEKEARVEAGRCMRCDLDLEA